MKKLAISLILISSAPIAMAASNANNNLNSNSYSNNPQSIQANGGYPDALGPQHIHNKALYANQNTSDSENGFDLDSGMLGMHGPLSINSIYSSEYGLIMSGQYTQAFGQSNAGSLEADLGKNERRLNGTWGLAMTQRQRLKLTAEYLEQNIDFNFLSGDTHQWVGQAGYGATYQYLLSNRFLQDINVNSTYSTAKSKNLSNKDMPNNANLINVRRIAGGTDKSLSAGVDLTPFSTTTLGVALNYDKLNYDIKYHNQFQEAKDTKGFGATINLSQLITKHIKIQLGASDRKPYDSYQGEVDYLAHTHPGSQLSLGLTSMRTLGGAGLPSDTRFGLNLSYAWGGNTNSHPSTYSSEKSSNNTVNVRQDLAQWTATPAVHRSQVLAVADQKLETRDGKTSNNSLTGNAYTILPVKAGSVVQGNASGVIKDVNLVLNQAITKTGITISSLPLRAVSASSGLFYDKNPNGTDSIDTTRTGYATSASGSKTPLSKIGLSIGMNSNNQVVLKGNPTAAGTYTVYLYDKNGSEESYAQIFNLKVTSKTPSFVKDTITSPQSSTVGQAYSFNLDSTNYINDPAGLSKDKTIQLVPTDANTWSKYGFQAGKVGTVEISGTPTAAALAAATSGKITLSAKVKNQYGSSTNANILIPVSSVPVPKNLVETATVGSALSAVDISSDFTNSFPAGAKLTFKMTKPFTWQTGGAQPSHSNFDISVNSAGKITSSASTLPRSDEGEWTGEVTATDGKTTSAPATVTMNVISFPEFDKTVSNQTASTGDTQFIPLDMSKYLDSGYQPKFGVSLYHATGLSDLNLKIDPVTGVISLPSGKSIAGTAGTHHITVFLGTVADKQVHATKTSFDITLNQATPKNNGTLSGKHVSIKLDSNTFTGSNANNEIDFFKGFDNVSATTTYSIQGLPQSNLVLTKDGKLLLNPNDPVHDKLEAHPGNYTLQVTAHNGSESSQPITLYLNILDDAPNTQDRGKDVHITIKNETGNPVTLNKLGDTNLVQDGLPANATTVQSGGEISGNVLATSKAANQPATTHAFALQASQNGQTYSANVYAPTYGEQCQKDSSGKGINGSCSIAFSPLNNFYQKTQPYAPTSTRHLGNYTLSIDMSDSYNPIITIQ